MSIFPLVMIIFDYSYSKSFQHHTELHKTRKNVSILMPTGKRDYEKTVALN